MALKKIPKKYQPKGYDILYEDRDLFVGNKAPGFLTVAAKFDRVNTIHNALNQYVRKGQVKSHKSVFVVHRLDQATSGILLFAKTEAAQIFLKENWPSTTKIYLAVVHGHLKNKKGRISSHLEEDEDYVVHSSNERGKLAHTEYEVIAETAHASLLRVHLLTGRKNQIRVHLADEGHPVIGDSKYGNPRFKFKNLALHALSIEFTHPFSKKRMAFAAPVPRYFHQLVPEFAFGTDS